MEWIIALFAVVIVLQFFGRINTKKRDKETKNINKSTHQENSAENEPEEIRTLDLKNAYQPKWLFSYNEKDAFNKIKPITDKYGLTLLAKVRLLDLVEPQKGNPKYKTFFYKVQAKHVDFVICDKKLVARMIVELDDKSHDKAERIERDKFVDEVVQNVGYRIVHTRDIDPLHMEETIRKVFKIEKEGL